jgi:hypothetical protein
MPVRWHINFGAAGRMGAYGNGGADRRSLGAAYGS